MAGEAARGIADAARDTGVPVIFGVLTTENVEQALERASPERMDKGGEAHGCGSGDGAGAARDLAAMTQATACPAAQLGARVLSRKLALQGLYRWQLNRCPWQDLMLDFDAADDAPRADREFFQALVRASARTSEALDAQLARLVRSQGDRARSGRARRAADRDAGTARASRSAVSRGDQRGRVGLARRFGATDGHKFVNAVIDQAARELRPHEP